MNVVAIRAEIAAALEGIGIHVYDHDPKQAELPAAFVGFPDTVTYNRSMAGSAALTVPLLIIVDAIENEYAQMRLAAAISTEDTTDTIEGLVASGSADGIVIAPVKPALESHPKTAWSDLFVGEATDFGSYEIAGISGLGVVLPLTIQSRRTTS